MFILPIPVAHIALSLYAHQHCDHTLQLTLWHLKKKPETLSKTICSLSSAVTSSELLPFSAATHRKVFFTKLSAWTSFDFSYIYFTLTFVWLWNSLCLKRMCISPKKIYKWPIKSWKRCTTSLATRETQIETTGKCHCTSARMSITTKQNKT